MRRRMARPFENLFSSRWNEFVERDTSMFPKYRNDRAWFLEVAEEAVSARRIGLDIEFDPVTKTPKILGIASSRRCSAIPWDDNIAAKLVFDCLETETRIAGHAVLSADRNVISQALGVDVPLRLWDDSMIAAYLDNQDFCAMPAKSEDEADKQTIGLMGLRTMGPLYTGLPQWKVCRESVCFGPCPNHNEMWYCAVDAWAGLKIVEATSSRINRSMYESLCRLAEYCEAMRDKGIAVDWERVSQINRQLEQTRRNLFDYEDVQKSARSTRTTRMWLAPFNPNSTRQKIEYFSRHGIHLTSRSGEAAADKETVRRALERELRRLKVEYSVDASGILTIDESCQDDLPEPVEYLYRLDQYAHIGKDLKAWFSDEYRNADGLIHPRFIVTGTSTGRLASSNPNVQNIPKRGIGSLVRTAIVPRSSLLQLAKADKSQLELRIVLYYAGGDQPKLDAFSWLVEKSNGAFREAAEELGVSERDIAKSVAHAANYLEGIVVLEEEDLASASRIRERKAGALLVYEDWEYRGGIVAFTGKNLAQRLYGDASYENRAKALKIQETYYSLFPSIREWHKRLSKEVEKTSQVVSATGRYLRLYGTRVDDLKLAAAFLGQGGGADEVQECMLRFADLGHVAIIQVHDELVFEVPREWSDEQVLRFFEPFCAPSQRFGGIVFPIEVSRGMNWSPASDANPEGLVKIGKLGDVK